MGSLPPNGFPSNVRYRHSLAGILLLIPALLLIFGGATYSNSLNHSPWMWVWGGFCVVVPLLIIGRLLWLEKHGWWVRRTIVLPSLPAHFGSRGWKATLDQNGVTATLSDVLKSPPRTFAYGDIRKVNWEPHGRFEIMVAGKAPLLLNSVSEGDLMKMIALLTHYGAHIELCGSLPAIREGWCPRV